MRVAELTHIKCYRGGAVKRGVRQYFTTDSSLLSNHTGFHSQCSRRKHGTNWKWRDSASDLSVAFDPPMNPKKS